MSRYTCALFVPFCMIVVDSHVITTSSISVFRMSVHKKWKTNDTFSFLEPNRNIKRKTNFRITVLCRKKNGKIFFSIYHSLSKKEKFPRIRKIRRHSVQRPHESLIESWIISVTNCKLMRIFFCVNVLRKWRSHVFRLFFATVIFTELLQCTLSYDVAMTCHNTAQQFNFSTRSVSNICSSFYWPSINNEIKKRWTYAAN